MNLGMLQDKHNQHLKLNIFYTKTKVAGKEIMKAILITIGTKINKIPTNRLTTDIKDLHNENYRTPMKTLKVHKKIQEDFPHSL